MPIYEYRCQDCGHEVEKLQKIDDDPILRCPTCDNDSLKKLVSAVAFRLKGKGWYETDFKTGDKKNIVKDDKKTAVKKSEQTGSKSASSTTNSNATKTGVGKSKSK